MKPFFIIGFICLTTIISSRLAHASEAIDLQFDVRPFEENSTDALGMLEEIIKARQFYEEGDYCKASKLYSHISRFDPSLIQATIGHSKSELALNNPQSAISILSRLTASTSEADVLLSLATAKILPLNKAEMYLESRVTLHNDTRMWNLLGQIRDKNGETEKARDAYLAAENLGQRSGLLANNLGLSALSQGDYDSAVRYLYAAVTQSPETQKFHNNYRLSLLLSGNYNAALEGLTTDQATPFLLDAALIAKHQNEMILSTFLYEKVIEISPVYQATAERNLRNMPSKTDRPRDK